MRCGHCGKTFNLSQTIRKGKVTRVYYCRGYQTLRSAICTNKDRMPNSGKEDGGQAGDSQESDPQAPAQEGGKPEDGGTPDSKPDGDGQ